MSKIQWTDETWNPLTGCTKVSAGCKYCYAATMAKRLKAMGQPNYRNGFRLTLHEHMLERPLRWKKPRLVFVNSMSDLFHYDVPLEFIQRVFAVMREASQHTFQVLTKRAERLEELSPCIDWPPNVWMGVSVENAFNMARVGCLARTGAQVKFLSCEPLLGDLGHVPLDGIRWVIVGGESGVSARACEKGWIRNIVGQCEDEGVAVFVKQLGARAVDGTGSSCRLQHGKGANPDEWPADLRVREYPQ